MRKVGIMGGTFDPIHIGHLILGENAYLQFGLDKVVFMPSGNPPHKKERDGGTDLQHPFRCDPDKHYQQEDHVICYRACNV